jgi:hypothetical protein
MVADVRYALRGIRRSPLFAASVAATIGLGVLCSAFTVGAAIVVLATGVAALVPSLRATRIEPSAALGAESRDPRPFRNS